MKNCHITSQPIIEATDEYFLELHNRWLPVPKHWVGDFVFSHSFKIRSKT
jgi:hypothetical protein